MTGEMRHLLQSGMDIFYLRKKKKRCEYLSGCSLLLLFCFLSKQIINIIVETLLLCSCYFSRYTLNS